MASGRRKDLVHGLEHGEIQDLGSPILSKIQQAFMYIRTLASGNAHEKFSSYRSIEGSRCGAIHIAWDKDEARLVLFVKTLDFEMMDSIKKGELTAPTWLTHLAGSAQVEVTCLSFLDSVLHPKDGSPGLKAVIDDMTGHVAPRRVVCVGFCIGGSIATVAAPWVAVQWPTADVRCISFGSCAVGNAAFTAAFKWLVGISYRVMFRRDPVPAQSAVPSTFKHVHGAIYLCGEGMRPGEQPHHHLGGPGDIGDHTPSAYLGAVTINCERQAARERAAGETCCAKVAQCTFKCPLERWEQRRAARAASLAASRAGSSELPIALEPPSAESPTAGSIPKGSQLARMESMSSTSDSQDGDLGAITQQPTGLGAYVKAGVGSLLVDTATVSKAAFASAGSVFLRRSTSKPTSPPPQPDHQVIEGGFHKFDMEYLGPVKYAELKALRSTIPDHDGSIGTAPDVSRDSHESPTCAVASPVTDHASDLVPAQEVGKPAKDADPCMRGCDSTSLAAPFRDKVTVSGRSMPAHEVARSIMESAFINKGLCPPESRAFTQSLASMLGIVPGQDPTDVTQATRHACEAASAQHDVHAEQSTAAPASEQVAAALADSNAQPSAAGTAGGEPGEQWVGSLPPTQVAANAMVAAAENEGVAGASPMESLQKLDKHPDAEEAQRTSLDTDELSAQQYASKLTRTFSLQDRDSSGIDQKELSNLQKVLVLGKISQAAILAAAAYRNHETFVRQTGITNSRLIYDKEHHDTKVHVGWLEGGTAVFAFRGTASRQDGLQDVKIFSRNIDYLQELYPGVKAHLGFLQQFAAVCHPDRSDTNMAAVLKELSGGQTPNRVICCGHSLGGALATLGAAWAALEYPDADIRCITFGSPRVANKVFGKAFNALVGTSLRIVHGFDPIPSLPPSLMYKHVPGVIHIRRDDLLLKHRPWHTMLRSCVGDHSMLKYSSGIYKHMPGGLDSLPSFFAPKPVTKLCNSICKVSKRGRASSQQTDTDASVSSKKGSPPSGSNAAPEHVWAGSFLACWGSNDLDQQTSDPAAATAASKSGIEASDSASPQIAA